LKFVKVSQKKIVNVENKTIYGEGSNNYNESSSKTTVTDFDSESNKLKKNHDVAPEHAAPRKQAQRSDSTNTDAEPEVSEDAVNEALEAEEHARKAKILAISAVVTLLAGSIFLGIGLLVSLVLAAIARIQYVRSRRSRFNTANGQNDEELARKWLIAYWVLIAIFAILVIALILLLFW
jgi:hypothetical protein